MGVCHFLLVISSNLDPISHYLATIAGTGLQGHPRFSFHLTGLMPMPGLRFFFISD